MFYKYKSHHITVNLTKQKMCKMTQTMANCVTHNSFFTIFAVLFSSIFSFTKAMNNGFSIDLIHRDSPNSPFYDPSLSFTERMNNSFHRSFNRSISLYSRSSSIAVVASNNGEYLMRYSIGTPPVRTLGVADTGSDLIWTQCLPCKHCFKQQSHLFNPEKSSSYKPLHCKSKMCHADLPTSCNRTKKTCRYEIMYGDNSHSIGDLARETIRFGLSSKNKQVRLKKTVIGCGHDNAGTFSGDKESGIVGLGGGTLSLISQMGSSIGGKFSYCLAPSYQHMSTDIPTSKINFGTSGILSGDEVVTTPLAQKLPATYYFLTLEGVSVGKKRLDLRDVSFSFGEGNIILDSGTVLTLFSPEIYVKLEAMVKAAIKLPTVADPTGSLSLCYKSISVEKIPIITMHFTGADVKLGPWNTFVATSESSFCFAFAGSYTGQIYGNIAQKNFLVGYDLKSRRVSFKATDCSK